MIGVLLEGVNDTQATALWVGGAGGGADCQSFLYNYIYRLHKRTRYITHAYNTDKHTRHWLIGKAAPPC